MESLQRKQEIWQVMPLFDADTVQLQMFTAPSWISVGDGVRFFNREAFKNLSSHWDKQQLEQGVVLLNTRHEKTSPSCMLHGDLLRFLKQKSQPIQ
jgi:hypothetical protein